jgi:hypothetical protein
MKIMNHVKYMREETFGMVQKSLIERQFGELRTDKELCNLQNILDMKIGQEGGNVKVQTVRGARLE